MNNDRPPALKLRKWLMRNKESTLPGLTDSHKLNTIHGYDIDIIAGCGVISVKRAKRPEAPPTPEVACLL